MLIRNFLKSVDSFLFEPISTSAICIFRIAVGLSIFADELIRVADFRFWYGENGVAPYSHIHVEPPMLSAWLWIEPTDQNFLIFFWLLLSFTFTFTIGLATRFSTAILWFLYLSLRTRDVFFWTSIESVGRLFLPILIFAPTSEKFSIDNLIRRKLNPALQEKLCSPWAQRLVEIQIAMVYFRAFIVKVLSKNWLNGNGLNYSVHSEWAKHGLPPFLDNSVGYLLGTVFTLSIEFSLFTLIWFKKTRYWTLAVGAIFHMMLNWSLDIDFLEYAFIASYVVFLYPEDLEKILSHIRFYTKSLIPLR